MSGLSLGVLETALPIEIVGWGVLIASLLVTIGWLVYLYR